MDPVEVLRSRPRFEQVEKDYLAMLGEMRVVLSAAAPDARWEKPEPFRTSRRVCAPPFADVPDTDSATYVGGWLLGNIPDAVWESTSRSATEIAARYGFTKVVRVVDKPGRHVVDVYDGYGSHVELGTMRGTTLYLYGGCFLTQAASSASSSSSVSTSPS